mmetsp:Transcript_8823/g.17805  ORF Transcript_8823/g.17805 Transcript_8823/m.17805 type:complete len:200 (-) Transcript_8823:81-680(-)
MLYKIVPTSFSSGSERISCEVKQSGTLSTWLEGDELTQISEEGVLGAFSMPMLESILCTAVDIGSSGSDSPRGFTGHRPLAHPKPQERAPVHEESGHIDLSRLSLSEGLWERQMNWAVMRPYWRHQRTGETEWDEPEERCLHSRANLFKTRRRPRATGRGEAYAKRGGARPLLKKPIEKNQKSTIGTFAGRHLRPLRVA